MTTITAAEFGQRVRLNVERGWSQGLFTAESPDGPKCCLEGGRYMAADHFEAVGVPHDAVLMAECEWRFTVVGLLREMRYLSPICFNDAPDRTQAEVLALIDQAIAKCEEAQP